jgi:quinol monooxygenase YgiN
MAGSANGLGTVDVLVIVSGWLRVRPEGRAAYLDGCREVTIAARAAAGVIDFHLTPDPIEDDRINIFEQWESVEAVEAFRGSGTSDEQNAVIVAAHVEQHEIASTISLT